MEESIIKKIIRLLLGKTEGFKFQEKLLRLTTLLGFLFSVITSIFNHFTHYNSTIDLLGIISSIVYLVLYLTSIYRFNYLFLFYGFVLMSMTSVFLAWKYFDGYDGSAFFLLIMVIVVYSLLGKGIHSIIVVVLSIAFTIITSTIELFNPDVVMNYKDVTAKFFDIIFTVILSILFVFFVVKIVFNRYLDREYALQEKNELKEKNKIITEQNIKLTELNRTKDKFFSIISHDLINPIAAINDLIHLVDSDFNDMSNEEIKELLRYMKSSSKNLLDLTENLLTWARLQSGKISFNPQSTPLKDLVKFSTNVLQHIARKKNISIKIDIDLKNIVNVDVNMISTVIRNLVSNSIKFTDHDGKIEIKSKKEGNQYILTVSDTGRGMTTEKIWGLFQIDKNSSTLGSDGEKGTGLGLILCKEFVEKNNGKIWVESQLDKGTTFFISLPEGSY